MASNKQPFYHRVDGLLFTSTTGVGEERFIDALRRFFRTREGRKLGVVEGTVEIEPDGYADPEAGDPADLC